MHAKIIAIETKLLAHAYSRDRTRFRLPVETYEGWAMLASEKGAFQYKVADEAGEAKVGEIVLCPPGVPLHREMIEKLDFHYIQFHLKAHSSNGPIEFPYCGKIAFRDLPRLLSTLKGLREARNHVSVQFSEHLVADILYQFIEERTARRKEMKPRDEAIEEAIQYMNERAFQGMSMGSVAAHVGLSQSQFTRKFQKEIGISPVKYWTGVRLRKAMQLLAETDERLEAIAEQCGYQNSFYLSRVFTKEIGMPPTSYRSTHRV